MASQSSSRSTPFSCSKVGPPARIENAQVAVYLAYAAAAGHAMIARVLYLHTTRGGSGWPERRLQR